MDPVIISAIITLIGSAFVGIIGLRPSRSSTVPSLKEIRYQQLCLLFEPIEKMLARAANEDPDTLKNTVLEIRNLINDNYKLVPPFLYREVMALSNRPIVFSFDLEDLRTMNASLYNWHCKHLGFPYISKKIVRKYAPMYNRYIILKNIGYRSAPFLVILLLILLFILNFYLLSS